MKFRVNFATTMLTVLGQLLSANYSFSANEHPACTDLVAFSCHEHKLNEKLRNSYFVFSPHDPQNYSSRSFQKVTLEYAKTRNLVQPIAKIEQIGQEELSPILAETLDRIDHLFKNGNVQRAAELVALLFGQKDAFNENKLTIPVYNIYDNFWNYTLLGIDKMANLDSDFKIRHNVTWFGQIESLFFKSFDYTSDHTLSNIANGIGPFCRMFNRSLSHYL